MNPIRQGNWRIHSIEVNGQAAGENDGYNLLVSTGDGITIKPADVSFSINQATSRSAVLESRSQIFFADFFVRGEQLTLNMSRPSFAEKISLKATFVAEPVANFA